MEPLFDVRGASLSVGGKSLLEQGELSLRRGRITAVMGPVATGKSVLLSALAGQLDPEIAREGEWSFGGAPIPVSGGLSRADWVEQPKDAPRPRRIAPVLEAVSSRGRDALLMDEPDSELDDENLRELVEFLQCQKGVTTVAIVTHNLELARQCADDVLLLCASRIVASGEAGDFFENPPNELSQKWLATGNCWPERQPPPLPANFNWILPGQLAGMPEPGLMREKEEDLEAIATAGITQLVSLTETPFPGTQLRSFGIEGRHFPIIDMGIPGVGATVRVCRGIQRAIDAGGAVAVHCRAGLGRTGLVLACYLIYSGTEPEQAIERVRSHNSNYIQSAAQLEFVRQFRG